MRETLEKAIYGMLEAEPFFAHFFLKSRMVLDKKEVKTAAVCIVDTSPVFYFDTKWAGALTPKELAAVVKHEVLHLLFLHTQEIRRENIHKQVANVAMDCAINQYIASLPAECISLESVSKLCKEKLLPEQPWIYYYQALLKAAPKQLPASMDSHEEWQGQLSPLEKAVLARATGEAIKASAGKVPSVVMKQYEELAAAPKVNWKDVLRNFVARSRSVDKRASRKRINRRFGLTAPGTINKRKLTLGVCLDSSGSISDEDFKAFLTEVKDVAKQCTKVHVVEADCEVQDVYQIKEKGKVQLTRKGDGGTAYQPAITKCKELGCDAILYFGDFDCADTPTNPGVPFLWVGVGEQKPPAEFGSVVYINK